MTYSRVIRPEIFKHIPQLVAGISTRHGGVSSQAYQSLNLGVHTDDNPAAISSNLSVSEGGKRCRGLRPRQRYRTKVFTIQLNLV